MEEFQHEISVFNVDEIKDQSENFLACLLLQSLSDEFIIYHEPKNLVSPLSTNMKTLPDFSLNPRPPYDDVAKTVYLEVTKSKSLDNHGKVRQRHCAYDWLTEHPEARYLQLCQPVVEHPVFALSLITQLAFDTIDSKKAQQTVSAFLDNPRKVLHQQRVFFV